MAVVIIGGHSSRTGPVDQISYDDMVACLDAEPGEKSVRSVHHKNSKRKNTAIISMDFSCPPVREALELFRHGVRPANAALAAKKLKPDGSISGLDSSVDVTGHFFNNSNNGALKTGRKFSQYCKANTKGMGVNPEDSLQISTTTMRKVAATLVEGAFEAGLITAGAASKIHKADGHSRTTALKNYVHTDKDQAEAGKVLRGLGIGFALEEDSKGFTSKTSDPSALRQVSNCPYPSKGVCKSPALNQNLMCCAQA